MQSYCFRAKYGNETHTDAYKMPEAAKSIAETAVWHAEKFGTSIRRFGGHFRRLEYFQLAGYDLFVLILPQIKRVCT